MSSAHAGRNARLASVGREAGSVFSLFLYLRLQYLRLFLTFETQRHILNAISARGRVDSPGSTSEGVSTSPTSPK